MFQTPIVSILCVLIASVLGAGGQFLFKLAANRGSATPLGFLWTPWAFVGLACYLAVMVLFSQAFQRGGTVPVLYPIYATTFIWAAAMAWAIDGQPIRPIHIFGMVLLMGGIVCMSAGEGRAVNDTREHATSAGDETYAPKSRRPIADLFRATAHAAVQWCVRLGIHPDVVSYASIFASALAAICFWQAGVAMWLVIPAAGLCYLRLWLNMLDGMVALASGKASRRGEILNDLPDRISDVLIFAGVAHSGLCYLPLGYWAAIAAVLTAYVGTLGQAVAGERQFGGLMSKPWRMVVLHIGSWLMLLVVWRGGEAKLWTLTVLDWTLLVIIAGCVQTIAVRLSCILEALGPRR